MATPVYRPTYHATIPADAKYITKNGKRYAKFRLPKTGELVTGEVMGIGKDGKSKARIQQKFYVARIRRNGKTVRVSTGVEDKEAALAIRQKLQRDAEQGRAGIVDQYAEHRGTPLKRHLEDYQTHMEASGFSPAHIAESIALIERINLVCSFYYIEEFNAHALNRYLVQRIRDGRSYRTRNKDLQQMRAFVHWLMKVDRMEADPFRTCVLLNQAADPNPRIRRALSAQELTRLCEAAATGPVLQGIEPAERALIYATAATTGLRAKEMANLRVCDLSLDTDIPYISLPSAIAKARREATIPLHPAVATRLNDHVSSLPKSAYVFHLMTTEFRGGTGGKMRLTNRMIRSDLKRAGIPHHTPDGHVDFHALRTTFITHVCRQTDQFTAMRLVRHTKATTTAKHYDKVLLEQRAKVVAALPAPGESKANG
jgi:integrase